MDLRPYQIIVKNKVYEAWDNGKQNVMIQMPTGSGKTLLFTSIIREFNKPALVVAHRTELIGQTSLALALYGIRHTLIAQKPIIKQIIALHILRFGKSFFDSSAPFCVAAIDTLLRKKFSWFNRIQLLVQDEAHHVLVKNKWGKVAQLFPNARGLYPTATPIRADGYGLGRHADGIIDELIIGPPMRDLINAGYLCDYKIIAPKTQIDLINVPISASGDYSPPKLRTAIHKSTITGDVVSNYLKFAKGKLGITFAVDVQSATEIAAVFRENNIPAEVISAKTPDILRAKIMQQFKDRKILQLVNVDLLGEGVDVPAVEVVIMARPTQSYALFIQQFGRGLRPLEGKDKVLIIDHTENILRHGLPDRIRIWSLDRRERKKNNTENAIPLKTCANVGCLAVYDRYLKNCPFCNYVSPTVARGTPEIVEGDLLEIDPIILKKMRGEIARIDAPPQFPANANAIVCRAIEKRHEQRKNAQKELRKLIAQWAGFEKQTGKLDSEIYKLFYFTFNIDVLSAQVLGTKEATELSDKIQKILTITYGFNYGNTKMGTEVEY